jgi:hypothetical protein
VRHPLAAGHGAVRVEFRAEYLTEDEGDFVGAPIGVRPGSIVHELTSTRPGHGAERRPRPGGDRIG